MYTDLKDIDPEIRKLVKLSYPQKTVRDLKREYQLSRAEVLAILGKKAKRTDLPSYDIRKDKCIFISDTHQGSIYEKEYYLKYVYRYAFENEIYDIVHGGDVTQGRITPLIPTYTKEEHQIDHIVNDYPYYKPITTHMLLGNHDFDLFSQNDQYLRIVKNRHDFNILGYKRAYLKWGKFIISLTHQVKDYHINIPDTAADVYLYGHRHKLKCYSSTIYLPTLSLDCKVIDGSNSLPGFILGQKTDNKLKFYYYAFEECIKKHLNKNEAFSKIYDEVPVHNKGCILTLEKGSNDK